MTPSDRRLGDALYFLEQEDKERAMEEADQLIQDCINRESRLTDWERGFIDSVQKRRDDGRILTVKELDKLDEVWLRVTAKG